MLDKLEQLLKKSKLIGDLISNNINRLNSEKSPETSKLEKPETERVNNEQLSIFTLIGEMLPISLMLKRSSQGRSTN